MKTEGTLIAAHGRQYRVEGDDGAMLLCYTRGKKSEAACGDRVAVTVTGEGQGVIERIGERRSLLYRSNAFRQKLIAANVTQILIVVATEPAFSTDLVTRCLVAAESQGIAATIVLNKCDLGERVPAALAELAVFEQIGYPLLRLSARQSAAELRPRLAGQTSVLVGQSGMGKSTLTNALIPGAEARTREISEALGTGKHTTTHATLYRLDAETALIDSPGLQEFGLHHLSVDAITEGFPEIRRLRGACRFRDCRHLREPDCAVRAALERGEIDPRRLRAFQALCVEAA